MPKVVLFTEYDCHDQVVEYFIKKFKITNKIKFNHYDYPIMPEHEKDVLKYKLSGDLEGFYNCVLDTYRIHKYVDVHRWDEDFVNDIEELKNKYHMINFRIVDVDIENGEYFRIDEMGNGYENVVKFDPTKWFQFNK